MIKSDWLNDYRIFPRLFAGFYMYWMAEVLNWAMELDNPKQAEWLVAAVVAGAAAYFKFYVETGKSQND